MVLTVVGDVGSNVAGCGFERDERLLWSMLGEFEGGAVVKLCGHS